VYIFINIYIYICTYIIPPHTPLHPSCCLSRSLCSSQVLSIALTRTHTHTHLPDGNLMVHTNRRRILRAFKSVRKINYTHTHTHTHASTRWKSRSLFLSSSLVLSIPLTRTHTHMHLPDGNLIVMAADEAVLDLRSHTETWRGLKDQQVAHILYIYIYKYIHEDIYMYMYI